jgi:hypothetical protein
LVGMQRPLHEEVRKLYRAVAADTLIDQGTVVRLKTQSRPAGGPVCLETASSGGRLTTCRLASRAYEHWRGLLREFSKNANLLAGVEKRLLEKVALSIRMLLRLPHQCR